MPEKPKVVPAQQTLAGSRAPLTPQLTAQSDPSTRHSEYTRVKKDWTRVRDCVRGESAIKAKKEVYLPRPSGMSGEYAAAYDDYIERAHFPLIGSYALQGALGVVISKLPEFNLPPQLNYLKETATKDGQSLTQLFLNVVIEILQTGRCPLLVDVLPNTHQFRFVQYTAESLINWKSSVVGSEKHITLGVLEEAVADTNDIFSHTTETVQRVVYLDAQGNYACKVFSPALGELPRFASTPKYLGRSISEIPLFIAGSINNSFDMQPVPLLSVANCSVQIYRKEADLANSEFLSCNPTLVISGVSNDAALPNVVGSSVMINLPDAAARAYYTTTDTAALTHVKEHISDLYEEGIRHGIAILDSRKGVESAEALRIRQATQSASVYSVYLAALNAIKAGIKAMCVWAGYDSSTFTVDAPPQLTYGIPEASLVQSIVDGFAQGVVPIAVAHRYLVSTGLVDQTVSLQEYIAQLRENNDLRTPVSVAGSKAVPATDTKKGKGNVPAKQ